MDARLTADEDRPPYVHLSWAEGRRPRPNVNAHRHVSPRTDGAWHGLLGPCCGIGHRRRRDARTGATVGKAETLRRRGRPHTSHLAIGIVTQRAKTRGTRGLVRSRRRRRRVEPGPTKEASSYIRGNNARVRAYPLPLAIGLLPLVPHPMPMLPSPHPLGVTGPIAGQHSSTSKRGETPFWGPGALRLPCITDFIDSFAPKTIAQGPRTKTPTPKIQEPRKKNNPPPKNHQYKFIRVVD